VVVDVDMVVDVVVDLRVDDDVDLVAQSLTI
jgi:hypothetical protein